MTRVAVHVGVEELTVVCLRGVDPTRARQALAAVIASGRLPRLERDRPAGSVPVVRRWWIGRQDGIGILVVNTTAFVW